MTAPDGLFFFKLIDITNFLSHRTMKSFTGLKSYVKTQKLRFYLENQVKFEFLFLCSRF